MIFTRTAYEFTAKIKNTYLLSNFKKYDYNNCVVKKENDGHDWVTKNIVTSTKIDWIKFQIKSTTFSYSFIS